MVRNMHLNISLVWLILILSCHHNESRILELEYMGDMKVIEDTIRSTKEISEITIIGSDCHDVSICDNMNKIPEAVYDHKEIKKLRLISCGIRFVPARLSELDVLTELDLSDNRGIQLDSLSVLTQLEVLNLNGCDLYTLPEVLSKLKNLKRLGLQNNFINPKQMQELKLILTGCEIYY